MMTAELGHLGAGGAEPCQKIAMFGFEVVGPGEEHPGEPAMGDVATVGIRAALVDVPVQEVQAAGEPEGLDLFEEVLDGHGGIFGTASAEVLAVRVDKAGAVFGDAEHPLGPVGSCVAFDGVQGQLQSAGAFEQAHALHAKDNDPHDSPSPPQVSQGRYIHPLTTARMAVIRSFGSANARLAVVVRRSTDQSLSAGMRSGA
jgi:hypothetical protein